MGDFYLSWLSLLMTYYDLVSIISDSDSGEIIAERKKRFNNSLDLKDYVHKFVDSSFRGVYSTKHYSLTFDFTVKDILQTSDLSFF